MAAPPRRKPGNKGVATETSAAVQVPYDKRKQRVFKGTKTLALGDELTARIRNFADQAGMEPNQAITFLINAGLSADPMATAIGMAQRKEIWRMRMNFFSYMNNCITQYQEQTREMQREAALAAGMNPIHIEGEEPPIF